MAHASIVASMEISFEGQVDPPGPGRAHTYDAVISGVWLDGVEVAVRLTIDDARQPTGRRMVCSAVKVEAKPGVEVTTSMLRDLRLRELRGYVVESRLDRERVARGEPPLFADGLKGALGADGPTPKNLEIVGRLYMRYQATGAPVKVIMSFFGISRSTATRWVQMSREGGYFDLAMTAEGGIDGLDQ